MPGKAGSVTVPPVRLLPGYTAGKTIDARHAAKVSAGQMPASPGAHPVPPARPV